MNLASIHHRASDNYCYALDDQRLIVALTTGYDVSAVTVVYNDPYLGGIMGGNWQWHGRREPVLFTKELGHHLWWTTTLFPEYKRCKYYFEIEFKDGSVICYFEDGFVSPQDATNSRMMQQMFTFPWLNPIDINRVPEWVNNTIWYQIFPDRFCRGEDNTPVPSGHKITPWQYGKVTNKQIYGGNLRGIIDKLDYLQDLGISGLYLNPIFAADSIHKYDTIDYYRIDPQFGTADTFSELVAQAHKRGMRVMLDGVFNHTGNQFFAWEDVKKYGRESSFFHWYIVNEFPFANDGQDSKNKRYCAFAFQDSMPKLNTNHPDVIAYLLKVCRYWIERFDVDGLRIDVANEVSHELCRQLRRQVKQLKSDFYILGEIWHDAMIWLRGDEFDSVMNYPLTNAISKFWLKSDSDKRQLHYDLNRCYTRYMQQTNDVLFNLLDSHDTQRLMSRVQGNIDAYYQQLVLLLAMPGSPCLYYGSEIALEGEHDPDCRRCMPWDMMTIEPYQQRLIMVKQLIALRTTHSCMRSRHYHFANDTHHPRVIELLKVSERGQRLHIILNAAQHDVSYQCCGTVLFSHRYYGSQLEVGGILVYTL